MWILCKSNKKVSERGFNRYMVECECSGRAKDREWAYSFNRYMVECEYTWFAQSNYKSDRFNRYMVECEFHKNYCLLQTL